MRLQHKDYNVFKTRRLIVGEYPDYGYEKIEGFNRYGDAWFQKDRMVYNQIAEEDEPVMFDSFSIQYKFKKGTKRANDELYIEIPRMKECFSI